ncbi:IgGFc-binding protein, partial [Myxococcota bacterium]|nr:IgGFc-binding protein [Myxococcota bacterium]
STDPPECVSECISNCVTESATACAGTLIQTCTDVGDGCLQWRDGTDCDDTTQLCDDEGGTAECYTPCVSTCTTALTNQCVGTMLQTCTDVGDGCLQWQDDTECDPGVCANGLGCVLCTPGSNACDGNTSLTCRADGSGYDETSECDPVMGSACDAGTGLCTGPCAPHVLGRNYIGCDFFPTATPQHDSYNTAPTNQFAVAVSNTTGAVATITITRAGSTVSTTTVAANSVQIIYLPWIDTLTKGMGPSKVVSQGAYRLRSDQPITVYQYNPFNATTTNDASLLFPVNVWGEAYTVASWAHWSGYPGFYSVIASEDNTTVTLAPSTTGGTVQAGGGVAANGTGTVVLNAGDVLQVYTSAGDLTGTHVNSDHPVQVFGGHKCTNIPSNITACDHLEESMFPIDTLAHQYVIAPPIQVPNNALEKAQIVRVIATEANTSVTFEPDLGRDQVLVNAGDFIELSMSIDRFVVSADHRILVAQYMVGQSAGYGTSDPSMLLAITPEQWRSNYLIHAPVTWVANFVDILANAGTTVTVDGVTVTDWWPIGTTGFVVGHMALSNAGNGNHVIDADAGVGVSVYGVQNAGSYWYPGGLNLLKY